MYIHIAIIDRKNKDGDGDVNGNGNRWSVA